MIRVAACVVAVDLLDEAVAVVAIDLAQDGIEPLEAGGLTMARLVVGRGEPAEDLVADQADQEEAAGHPGKSESGPDRVFHSPLPVPRGFEKHRCQTELRSAAGVQPAHRIIQERPMPTKPPSIRDDPEHNRFVMAVPAGEAFATYRRLDDYLVVSHTEVPSASRGQGLGSQLAEALFEHARGRGERIVPACSFIAAWARQHPEYQDVLAQRTERT
ncbi:GNAT family N-acetyltransferase [Bosea sp. TAF32]|uniref:GNAT family N-acetyltransferase n=1 Tax=Bosea sp. TAF32 TaxID=3237482 RepID=UPI003F8E23B8